MQKAVIYARYSSDNQSEVSIEDQVHQAQSYIANQGWGLVATFEDRAISGSTVLRPGYQKLLEGARTGSFDIIVAEALDRLSRDQADVATLFKHLEFLGIKLVTLAEGEISELHVGLKGTMNALFLKDLAQKTRRGLEGRIRQGRSAGGKVYGYDLNHEFDGNGEPVHGGLSINQAEAVVVERIYRNYVAGLSPRKIAHDLNAEGITGPNGRPWQGGTLRGHSLRRNGILRNDLYVGRMVWNRQSFYKDPTTGRRRPRLNPPEEWVINEVPHLRIIDDELAADVRARLDTVEQSDQVKKVRASRFWEKRRAKHLLTGLVRCGVCNATMAAVGGDYLACSAARKFGTCTNRRGVPRKTLESVILTTLQHHLMAPELVKQFTKAFHEEVNRQQKSQLESLGLKKRNLAEVTRKLDGLIDAIAGGLRSDGLQAKLENLESQRKALEAEISGAPPAAPTLHPNLPELYRRRVAELEQALADPETHDEALTLLRQLIDYVEVTPDGKDLKVEFVGQIANMLVLPTPSEARRMAKHKIAVKGVAGACNQRYLPLSEVWL